MDMVIRFSLRAHSQITTFPLYVINPLAVAGLCYRSTNCTGKVVEGPLTARECCVGTEDGHSYEVNGVCTVAECRGNSLIMAILPLHYMFTDIVFAFQSMDLNIHSII